MLCLLSYSPLPLFLFKKDTATTGEDEKPESKLWILGMAMSIFASLCVTVGLAIQKQVHRELEATNDHTPYFKKPKWLFGLILVLSDAFIDMATFAMAPASLLAPLGAMTLVWNTIIAPCMLKEKLTRRMMVATAIIIVGATLAVAFSSHNTPLYVISDEAAGSGCKSVAEPYTADENGDKRKSACLTINLPEAEKEFGGKGSKACAYGDGTNWMPVDRFLRLFGMLCHVVVMLCVL